MHSMPANKAIFTSIALLCCSILTACSTVALTSATVTDDRRTLGTVVEDRNLPKRAVELINSHGELGVFDRIQVDAYNEVLLLTGEVQQVETGERLDDLVSELPKVRRVVNELEVLEKASWWRRRADGLLATRVKTSLFGVRDEDGQNLQDFDPTRVKVVVAHGNVYLMGLLTQYEADQAAYRAANTKGAQRVIKVFDYLDEPKEN